ncbi:MAG TPA: substrate-binding domain-containing protein [Bryobacteraceae bacterium]|nr:substrate-binding domain-containing protein [Bryobacteraceae bacterium]
MRAALLAVLVTLCAAAEDGVPAYQPQSPVSGVLGCWGSTQMGGLLKLWQAGFQHFHPGVRFENHMYGAVSAVAGLYTGVADLALSREIWPEESQAYEQVKGHAPVVFEVATGSFDIPTKSDALGIFVAAPNPIEHLTLAQLASIFTAPRIARWGDLGLSGTWAARPIHRYAYLYNNAGLRLFRDLLNAGSPEWNWETKGFGNEAKPGGGRIDAGRQILDALAADEDGIAISNPHYADRAVKCLAIGREASGPFVALTRESAADRSYPLTRGVFLFADRVDARIAEFLRYILSREGRAGVLREGDYLPLPDSLLLRERSKIR